MGFVVDKVTLGQVSPSISVSIADLHSTNCSTITIIYHLGLVKLASSGRSTNWTQSHPTKNNNSIQFNSILYCLRTKSIDKRPITDTAQS
jgi:hypothetical protein